MNSYLYQNWLIGYREMQSEEKTLNYYLNHLYKPKYDPNLGNIEIQKKANKFLKPCKSSEEWAKFAYENGLQFEVCKMDGHLVESTLEQDVRKDIVIAFLDEYDRIFMVYLFRQQPNKKYFLFGMKFWEFIEGKDDDDDYTTYWKYIFEPNGNVQVIEWEKDAEEECIWTSKKPLNVENNWQEKPEFGDWEGFFKMKRWADGELDEAFKGKNITTFVISSKGERISKTNQPYNFLSVERQEKVDNAIAQAKEYDENGEKEKVFKELEQAFYNLPKPKENYEASSKIILEIIDYNNLYKNHEEAIRLIDKLEKYLNADNYYLLSLHKGKVYFEAGEKKKSREAFDEFIRKNDEDLLIKEYPEHWKMFRWNM